MKEQWNRCDACGRFVAYEDFATGAAVRALDTPDSAFSTESFATLCPVHASGRPGDA